MVVFVVKQYAVRETEKWRYAVRKAKIGWYAVCKGGGGVTLKQGSYYRTYWLLMHIYSQLVSHVYINTWLRNVRGLCGYHFLFVVHSTHDC